MSLTTFPLDLDYGGHGAQASAWLIDPPSFTAELGPPGGRSQPWDTNFA